MVNDPATAPLAPTKPRAAIFDFDGTIADTIEEARLIVNRLAPDYGFAPVSREMAESLRGGGVREAIDRLGIRPRQLPGLHVAVRRHLRARMAEVKPFPGIGPALRALTGGGLQLGILSSNSRENVEAFLGNAGLRQFFTFVAGGSSLFGKARHLRRLLAEELDGTPSSDVVYVGDETRDITAARKVGLRCAAVTWGANTESFLASARPDYLFHTPADLARAWGEAVR
jgi:phosphoglycolate phosphatase